MPFIQFTYAVVAPMPARLGKLYRHRLEPGLAQPAAGTRVGVPPSGMTDVLDPRSRLIVALDVASVSEARTLVERIGDAGVFYKIGYQLAFAGGLALAGELFGRAGRFFSISSSTISAIPLRKACVPWLGPARASHGTRLSADDARRRAGKLGSDLKILAVTVLTSYDDADLTDAGYALGAADLVARRATQARDLGLDGIVCAPTEAEKVRELVGRERLVVTPGVRPAGTEAGDQKRSYPVGRNPRRGKPYRRRSSHHGGGPSEGRRRGDRGRDRRRILTSRPS